MNIKRTLGYWQLFMLEALVRRYTPWRKVGDSYYKYAYGDNQWAERPVYGSSYLRELNKFQFGPKFDRHSRALRALVQRGLVVPDEAGILHPSEEALKLFEDIAPKPVEKKRTFPMSRTRPARKA